MPTINNIEALLAFNHSIEQRAVDADQEGKKVYPFTVEVKDYKKTRSLAQNNRHWSILEQIVYWMGKKGEAHEPEVWHIYFKREFLESNIETVKGKPIQVYSSHDKNTKQFADFTETICAWAGDNEIEILDLQAWREFKRASR